MTEITESTWIEDVARVRKAAQHMRDHHREDHPRHVFWNALADHLERHVSAVEAWNVTERIQRLGEHYPAVSVDDLVTVITEGYLDALADEPEPDGA